MNKKIILLIPILIGIMFVLPMLSAALTLNKPIAKSNNTATIIFNCTKAIGDEPYNATNVTLWYNASGGGVGTMFTGSTINNDSTDDTYFYLSGISISALSDGSNYNISCKADNGTSQAFSPAVKITIDNTNPIATLSLDTASISTHGTVTTTWSSSDAMSGVNTVVTTVTSPDSSRCPTLTYTDTAKIRAITGEQTKCSGTYTVLETVTDFAGNVGTSTKTFKTYDSGLSKSGSNTLGGTGKSKLSQGQEINSTSNLPLGDNGTKIAILGLLAGALWYFFKKK